MKRAKYFVTADGKYASYHRHDHPFIRELLTDKQNGQISMFDSGQFPQLPSPVSVT